MQLVVSTNLKTGGMAANRVKTALRPKSNWRGSDQTESMQRAVFAVRWRADSLDQRTVRESPWNTDFDGPMPSLVAETVNGNMPARDGVPLNSPSRFNPMPGGKTPVVNDHESTFSPCN